MKKQLTFEDVQKLISNVSSVEFAGSVFEFANMYPKDHLLHKTHIIIFDEPPSAHMDSVLISNCFIESKGGKKQ